MPSDLYTVRDGHPPAPFGIPSYLFRAIDKPGYLLGDVAITSAGATYEWNGSAWVALSISGGGGGGAAQTPWTSAIDGGGFALSNVSSVTATTFIGALTGHASLDLRLTGGTVSGAITLSGLTASRALILDSEKAINVSAVTDTELGYLSGVTSAIQTQFGSQQTAVALRVLKTGDTMTGLLQFSGTGHFGLQLNSLTTTQRDAVGVGVAGNVIWNSTTSRYDFNIGGSWKNLVRLDGDTMTGLLTITQATANTGILASTGYSLTGSNATSLIDLAGTWNTSGTPTAFKLNITNTASNAASLLADYQVGGSSIFKIATNGITLNNSLTATIATIAYNGALTVSGGGGDTSGSDGIRFKAITSGAVNLDFYSSGGSLFTRLRSPSANILELINSTNAQNLSVYGTFTDSSNYERMRITVSTSSMNISHENAGTGSARAIGIGIGGAVRWQFNTSGHFIAGTDNTYDIGQSGATRPRNLYVAGTGSFGGALDATSGTFSSFGIFSRFVRTVTGTLAGLPAASTAGEGARAFINDANTTVILGLGQTAVGGGANKVPVYSDGTNWILG